MSRAETIILAEAWRELVAQVLEERDETFDDEVDDTVLAGLLREKIREVEGEDV